MSVCIQPQDPPLRGRGRTCNGRGHALVEAGWPFFGNDLLCAVHHALQTSPGEQRQNTAHIDTARVHQAFEMHRRDQLCSVSRLDLMLAEQKRVHG